MNASIFSQKITLFLFHIMEKELKKGYGTRKGLFLKNLIVWKWATKYGFFKKKNSKSMKDARKDFKVFVFPNFIRAKTRLYTY